MASRWGMPSQALLDTNVKWYDFWSSEAWSVTVSSSHITSMTLPIYESRWRKQVNIGKTLDFGQKSVKL